MTKNEMSLARLFAELKATTLTAMNQTKAECLQAKRGRDGPIQFQ